MSGDDSDTQADDRDPQSDGGSGDAQPVTETFGKPDDPDPGSVYNDRDKLDFDPDEGFLSGTAIRGGTEIPGEHELVDDVAQPDEDESSDGDSVGSSDGKDDGDDEDASGD